MFYCLPNFLETNTKKPKFFHLTWVTVRSGGVKAKLESGPSPDNRFMSQSQTFTEGTTYINLAVANELVNIF